MREGGATDTPVDCASVTTKLAPPRARRTVSGLQFRRLTGDHARRQLMPRATIDHEVSLLS